LNRALNAATVISSIGRDPASSLNSQRTLRQKPLPNQVINKLACPLLAPPHARNIPRPAGHDFADSARGPQMRGRNSGSGHTARAVLEFVGFVQYIGGLLAKRSSSSSSSSSSSESGICAFCIDDVGGIGFAKEIDQESRLHGPVVLDLVLEARQGGSDDMDDLSPGLCKAIKDPVSETLDEWGIGGYEIGSTSFVGGGK